jgi:sec-independent protein translocase protein TatA
MTTFAFLPNIGMTELIVLAVLGLLIFGRRLPEVGRGLGRSIVEFRKGLKGIEDEVEEASSKPSLPRRDEAGRVQAELERRSAEIGGPSAMSGVPGTVPQQPHTGPGAG